MLIYKIILNKYVCFCLSKDISVSQNKIMHYLQKLACVSFNAAKETTNIPTRLINYEIYLQIKQNVVEGECAF